jgi:hypothetical protein
MVNPNDSLPSGTKQAEQAVRERNQIDLRTGYRLALERNTLLRKVQERERGSEVVERGEKG